MFRQKISAVMLVVVFAVSAMQCGAEDVFNPADPASEEGLIQSILNGLTQLIGESCVLDTGKLDQCKLL